MTSKQKLILFLASCDPGVKDIYTLVKLFDRADFLNNPSYMTENLQALIHAGLIRVTKLFDNQTPSHYSVTKEGTMYLTTNFNDAEMLSYIKGMANPALLLDLTGIYIDRKNKDQA